MTMRVHTIRVSFTREMQPKDYEKSAPTIEFSAGIDEGDDHVREGCRLMADACRVVYAALGRDVPEAVAAKLGLEQTPAGAKVAVVPSQEPIPEHPKERAKRGKAKQEPVTAPQAESGAQVKETSKAGEPPAEEVSKVGEPPAEEPPAEPAAITKEALYEMVSNLVSSQKISVQDVKAILAAKKAARLTDLDQTGRDFVAEKIRERLGQAQK